MISNTKNTIYLFFILSSVPFVLSIKCWDCRSTDDQKCDDPFDNSTVALTDCKHDKAPPNQPGEWYSICQKLRQKVNGVQVITRGCSWRRQDDMSHTCSIPDGPNKTISCEICYDRDGCNGASAVGETIALLLAPLCLVLFQSKS